jgi:hypothetical protein
MDFVTIIAHTDLIGGLARLISGIFRN